MHIDIKILKAFVIIAEERSITAASKRLKVTQPWISVQLQRLEDIVGAILFDRCKGQLFRMTPEGEELLPAATRMVTDYDAGLRKIQSIVKRDCSHLRIGFDPITLYMSERNNLVLQFRERSPNISLEIQSRSPAELFDRLLLGQLDLILTSLPAPEGIEALPLQRHNLQLFRPKAAGVFHSGTADLSSLPLLTLPDDYHPAMFHWLKSQLDPFGVEWVRCPEGSFEALIKYAKLLGICTLAPDVSKNLSMMREDFELVPRFIDAPLTVQWALMRRAGHRQRSATAFWETARAAFHLEPFH